MSADLFNTSEESVLELPLLRLGEVAFAVDSLINLDAGLSELDCLRFKRCNDFLESLCKVKVVGWHGGLRKGVVNINDGSWLLRTQSFNVLGCIKGHPYSLILR